MMEGTNQVEIDLNAQAKLLPRRLLFVPAKHPASGFAPPDNRYKPINSITMDFQSKSGSENSGTDGKENKNSGAPQPQAPKLKYPCAWSSSGNMSLSVGAGLVNLGNTCFLNSALQCLSYTPSLAYLLLSNSHGPSCKVNSGFCVYCALEQHVNDCLKSKKSISPKKIVRNLRAISKSFQLGRQEDAHEFLRFLVSGMQSNETSQSAPKKALSQANKQNALVSNSDIFSIFGGYLRSEVHCLQCDYRSWTFEEFLDLSLEIERCNTLEKCFQHFTISETLEKSNAYACSKCKKKTKATKQFTIHTPPNVLVVHLKRFSILSRHGYKNSKKVQYPATFDLAPFLSSSFPKTENSVKKCEYQLYGVLVHQGHSLHSGHYYSLISAPNKFWYTMNDESVRQSSIKDALNQNAYVLFYHRINLPEVKPQQQPIAQPTPTMNKSVNMETADVSTTNGKKRTRSETHSVEQQTPAKKRKLNTETNGSAKKSESQTNGIHTEGSTNGSATPATPETQSDFVFGGVENGIDTPETAAKVRNINSADDAKKSIRIVQELQRNRQNTLFPGHQVETWGDVPRDVIKSREKDGQWKNSKDKAWDKALDKGRVKKVKQKKDDQFGRDNRFQKVVNSRKQ
eukprot:TRINITY_DN713_c0_g1_i2.p2 TRINITY_DN713_c0_g1~~TRINITY_DN713_c0_g1_i2.p2  ORF type:complete len:627 (-),score=87.63 TRINITY_DN713_c0_g1_i2:10-1890(-)